VLKKIAEQAPELEKELELTVRKLLPYSTAAFRSRARRILKDRDYEESLMMTEDSWGSGQRMGFS
jgi:hypothetical protein